MASGKLYDEDFVTWTQLQADELRRAARENSNTSLDFENLAEEIESLGKRDRREAEGLVRLILVRLLKLAFAPANDLRRRWMEEVERHRSDLELVLEDSPSITAMLRRSFERDGKRAVEEVQYELSSHGETLAPEAIVNALQSLTLEQVLTPGWYPPRHADRKG